MEDTRRLCHRTNQEWNVQDASSADRTSLLAKVLRLAESERVKKQWVRGASCFSSLQPVRHLACEETAHGSGPSDHTCGRERRPVTFHHCPPAPSALSQSSTVQYVLED
ncbi:hypothetical protein AOLI_G00252670 [Acnodon oligacanthus]